MGSSKLTFGKEYELSAYLGFDLSRYKSNDGSGPSEISTPVFSSVKRAILTEYILYRIYGMSLFHYFETDDGDQQKGNHFHYAISTMNRIDYETMYTYYYIHAPLFLLSRKLLTLNESFRNTIDRWCDYFVVNIYNVDELRDYQGREYAFLTPNRNRKNVLTFELRASETSIVCDLSALALVHGIAMLLVNETNVSINDWKRYCMWIDREDYHLAAYQLPLNLDLPVCEEPYCKSVIEALRTIIPFEEGYSAGFKVIKVKDNSFRYLVEPAVRGWLQYGHHYEKYDEFLWLLQLFKNDYVNENRHRRDYVFVVYHRLAIFYSNELKKIAQEVVNWLVFG